MAQEYTILLSSRIAFFAEKTREEDHHLLLMYYKWEYFFVLMDSDIHLKPDQEGSNPRNFDGDSCDEEAGTDTADTDIDTDVGVVVTKGVQVSPRIPLAFPARFPHQARNYWLFWIENGHFY